MSDRTKGLNPELESKVLPLIESMEAKGHPVFISSGYRSPLQQNKLYEKGRTKKGAIVTNARPGWSWHNWGRAVDFAFKGEDSWAESHPWNILGLVGECLGLEWGGRWKSFKDRPHFELPGIFGIATLAFSFQGKLKKGFVSDSVKNVQVVLNIVGSSLEVDGFFGEQTCEAVLSFQIATLEDVATPETVDTATILALEKAAATK